MKIKSIFILHSCHKIQHGPAVLWTKSFRWSCLGKDCRAIIPISFGKRKIIKYVIDISRVSVEVTNMYKKYYSLALNNWHNTQQKTHSEKKSILIQHLNIIKSRRGLPASNIQIKIIYCVIRHSERHLINEKQLLSSLDKESVMKSIFLHHVFIKKGTPSQVFCCKTLLLYALVFQTAISYFWQY